MKQKLVVSIFLSLLILNLCLAQDQEKPSLKYLYDRYIAIGIKQLENSSYDQAKFEFEKAQFFLPDQPESYLNLALIEVHRYNYKEALGLLAKARRLIPENYFDEYIILYNLGLCSYQEENYLRASHYFSQCLKLKPQLEVAKKGLELSDKELNQQLKAFKIPAMIETKAETTYSQELERVAKKLNLPKGEDSPSKAAKLLEEASLSFKGNNTEKAIALLKQSISLEPKNPQAHYRLGVIYSYLSRFSEAAVEFEEAIKYDPSFVKAYINLGGVYGKLKDYPQAIASLKKALRIDKDNPKIYYNLGMIKVGMGKKRQAKRDFKKAANLCKKSGDTKLLQKIPEL